MKIAFLMILAAQSYAQVAAAISGRIEDPAGAAVSGAKVTVTSAETGAARTAVSDDAGSFSVLSLAPGPYEIQAEKAGFRAAVRTGVHLQVAQNAVVNFHLEIGEFVQQVTVAEDAPVVNTTTSAVSGVVGEREVKDLPLNGRSFDTLIALNPGTINYSSMKSANTSTSDGNTFSVAGRRTSENLFLINGVEYTGSSQLAVSPGGVSGELLGIDAVREFNVLTDTYSAEYGKRAGAQVSVVTQSGTNALHGSLFEFLRNSALDARNFLDRGFVPPFRRNQFGGALGGPVKKNRLFAFGNYEGFRQALAVSSVSVVPDALVRQGLIPNPTTGVYAPVPNLNPAMLPFMSLWPQPNGPELLAGGVASGNALSYNNPHQQIHENFGTARADWTIRQGDSLSVAYTIDDGNSTIPQADPLFASGELLRSQVASIRETHVFSPRVLNTATIGFSRAEFNLSSVLLTAFPENQSFVEGGGPGGVVVNGGVTTTGISGITSAGPNNAAGSWNRRNLFTYADEVQAMKGIHQISAGVWLQPLRDNEDSASRQLGQATFASMTTLLQGTVSTFQVIPNPNELGWRSIEGAWFVEDSMRLRPNLTVRVGLRYEFTNGWNEESGRAANYVADANGVLGTNVIVGHSVFTKNNATHLLAPRVGLAWDPFGDGKTAVRASYGTFYSLIDSLSFLLNSLPPANGAVSLANMPLLSIIPIKPGVQPAPQCSATVPQPCTTFAPQGVQPDAKTPSVQEWNLTLERQIDRNTSVRAAYVGSFGVHGLVSIDPNDIPAAVCASATCVSGGIGSTKGSVMHGQQYIPAGTRPNPYLGAGFFWYSEGNTSYHALQFDATRRLSRGWQFRANYTWSKNLDINSALTGAQANNQAQMVLDRNDLQRDWGPSALDANHQASISSLYALPGRGRVLGGWQINGIATLLSGFPFTPQIGANRSGDGDTRNPDRPSLNPAFNGPVVSGSPNQWFNPSAFVLPTAGTYGNLGRGVYRGPGLAEVDLSLFKTTKVTEKTELQFRAEFFNALNHPNFGTPNATVFAGTAFNPSAGLVTTTTTTSRQIQFGLKLVF
ncbi:MAG TPA: carboxypeptidase regulatory-like domain-containing protein [Bryobacteraceae bacterium]|nr:carboxypeptidase regulatory-like domain-containing protein [Bryobacteraceae bacterium]